MASSPALLSHFVASDEAAEAGIPWTRSINAIRRTRQANPDGLLLFDRLFALAGIDSALYPPSDYTGLRSLLSAIEDSETFDSLKRACLVYYLLKDYKDGRELAFARSKRIPKRFVTSTDGYWNLDNKQFELGVKKLCSPGVTPDFVSEILQTLATAVPDKLLSSVLITNFVTFAAPQLGSHKDIQLVVNAHAIRGSPADALVWLRRSIHEDLVTAEAEGHDEEAALAAAQRTREQMMGEMLETCFSTENPDSGTLEKLLYLPFTAEEDTTVLNWISSVTSCASSASVGRQPQIPASGLLLVTEWSTSRLVAQGRYVDAITILTGSLSSLRTSSDGQRRTQESLKELYAALPPIQRSAVDLQLQTSTGQSSKAGKGKVQANGAAAKTQESATGHIAQLPWLAQPIPPALPAPRSLLDAKANAAVLAEAKAGGPRLNAVSDLPVSAGGLLREGTASASGVGQSNARRDARIDLLGAVRRAESPMKGVSRTSAASGVGLAPGSPFRSTGTPGSAHTMTAQPGREGSPFSRAASAMASPYHTLAQLQQAQAQAAAAAARPTVPAFGLQKPSSFGQGASSRLDFNEQLRKHSQQDQHAASSTPRGPSRVPIRNNEQADDAQQSQHASAKGCRKALPPGAFPMSGSVAGSTAGTRTDDSDDSDDSGDAPQQTSAGNSEVKAKDFSAPPARSTRAAARRTSSAAQAQPSESAASAKKSRQRTTSSKDVSAPTPAKKGKRNPPSKTAEATPRRSRRLGSVAPSEPEMMHPEDNDEEDESMLENSMIGRGGAGTRAAVGNGKTPRRRRP